MPCAMLCVGLQTQNVNLGWANATGSRGGAPASRWVWRYRAVPAVLNFSSCCTAAPPWLQGAL